MSVACAFIVFDRQVQNAGNKYRLEYRSQYCATVNKQHWKCLLALIQSKIEFWLKGKPVMSLFINTAVTWTCD